MLDIKLSKSSEEELFPPQEFFNEQWKLYQKILDNNYMGHREIYSTLRELLLGHFQQPFKMLDLGCGDASFTSQALLNSTITSYQGIDLSIPALEIAKNNMAKIQCHTTFTQGNISQFVPELMSSQQNSFDVILSSFVLHHLSLEEKDSIIGQLKHLLTSKGVFILIDVVRKEGEDRETYLKCYLDNVQKDWSLITPQEYLMLANHISSSDFPETQKTLDEISQTYNFTRFDCLYNNPLDATQLLCFYR
ncbi:MULTISPECIES: class I SAM-dependent methyltransferase [unclassified Nostoc]|uniref:class I SAM-dependent methyltransferase n=1 Tax=unclassified Nostoc TaxID=2593658 RepID=UPI0025AA77B3|nr:MULTISPECIES: class I SAM-dependent methyltransferase [unclassified Nostoc]MDM9583055.1 methyltransferase domain-containing protein [Nostoc sp. GT001]MDZ7946870.1 methyltransferase domain-containing protein [Nostoc sp. EfeVER01]MDZ7992864.1 methyltransferase domain-containing protein [Nostoc sp. EspVER01]